MLVKCAARRKRYMTDKWRTRGRGGGRGGGGGSTASPDCDSIKREGIKA